MLSLRQDLCVCIRRGLCIDVRIGGNNISGVFLFLHLWVYHLWLYVQLQGIVLLFLLVERSMRTHALVTGYIYHL